MYSKFAFLLCFFATGLNGQTQFAGPITATSGSTGTLIPYDWAENRFVLQSWDAAVSNVDSGGSARARYLWTGDSWSADGAQQLRAYFNKIYPDGGEGFKDLSPIVAGQGFNGSLTQTGTWTNAINNWTGAFGPGSTLSTTSDTATPASATVNFSNPTQTVSVWYIKQPTGGTFNWRRTASGATSGYTAQSTVGPANTLGTLAISVGGNSITSVDLQLASGTVQFVGIVSDSGTAGIIMHNIGRPGTMASDFFGADAALWQAEVAALAPNVVILEFGVNEIIQNKTPAQQITAIAGLVARINAAVPDAGIILVPPAHISDSYGTTYKIADFVNAQEAYARSAGLGFFSMYKILTPYDSPFAGGRQLWNNDDHYSTRGARVVMNVLGNWMMLGARH